MNDTQQIWATIFEPLPNPYSFHRGYYYRNESTLFSPTELNQYLLTHQVNEDHIWSLVHNDTPEHIVFGFHPDAIGFFITKNSYFSTSTESLNYDLFDSVL